MTVSYTHLTPMNAISGFTTLALSNIDDKDRVKDYLAKTLASSKDVYKRQLQSAGYLRLYAGAAR